MSTYAIDANQSRSWRGDPRTHQSQGCTAPALAALLALNPIEQFFAKLKRLRHNAEARTIDAVVVSCSGLLDRLAPAECAANLRNSGYASTQIEKTLKEFRKAPSIGFAPSNQIQGRQSARLDHQKSAIGTS